MRTLAMLFGRSPFAPLQQHLQKVESCIEKVAEIFEAFKEGNHDKVEILSEKLSLLEHEADLTKNDIRNGLPKGLFLPVERGHLLEILTLQDSIADRAEDIGIVLTLRKLDFDKSIEAEFQNFLEKCLEAFYSVLKVMHSLEDLLQASFGGIELNNLKTQVDDVAYKEHEADILQRKLLKKFFNENDDMPAPVFHLWLKIFSLVGDISNISEKLGNRVRMTIDLK